jgi:hypothetical protein
MKSAPEIWQLVEDESLVRAWMEELTGADGAVEARARRHERLLVWIGRDGGARLEFELEEKGFGTQVSISSDAGGDELLERLMEQLAEPERRPFARN